jgi:hypothetical protein
MLDDITLLITPKDKIISSPKAILYANAPFGEVISPGKAPANKTELKVTTPAPELCLKTAFIF